MRKRQLLMGIGAMAGMMVFILDGKSALTGGQEGIELCLRTVVPSLFPFFVLSILLTGAWTGTTIPVLKPFAKLLSLPEGAESLLIPAFFGGYPVGAQCISEAYRSGHISRRNAERILAFCSNAGPAFLFGMINSMFPETWMTWALWGIHVVSAFCVSAILPAKPERITLPQRKKVNISDVMASSVSVMLQVCGWVVLFRVILAFLDRWFLWMLPAAAKVTVTGLLELSNGCCALMLIKDTALRFLICSGMLACGGLCVTMQTLSVATGLSLRFYLAGKALQTVLSILFSAALMYGFWGLIPCVLLLFLIFPRIKRNNSSNPIPVGV